ncbi:uncharacterized protein LOC119083609 [Bradysia coprophila]|uniref:uncharacterized protein LOC119083609 n=1 Tax=Bradysia coprophila TaxID=38358 RepID=UPI00187DAF16|nr:uncharacterized protein LOC119083609 [Bradysia coprophila]
MVKHSNIQPNQNDRLHLKDYEPAESFDLNKIYPNLTKKMLSFFVVVTLVVLIWLIIKWLLKMLASLAWLVTLVFVTMYVLPELRGGNLDDVLLICTKILFSVFAESKKLIFKLIKKYMETAVEYVKS